MWKKLVQAPTAPADGFKHKIMPSAYLANSTIRINETKFRQTLGCAQLIILIILSVFGQFPRLSLQIKRRTPPQTVSALSSRAPQTYTQQGVSVELSIETSAAGQRKSTELLAGTEARVQFKIFDANRGQVLSNLRPEAWIDQRESARTPDARECREKIQSFLQPDFSRRPTIDLNAYFILTLNDEPNISVIDPLSGFSGSRLYTLVSLQSPGVDWVTSTDKKRLYVSMPLVDRVAVIDTSTWKALANIDGGEKPTRLALQHDGRYLWIGNDGANEKASGVTVIDTESLKVVAQLATGKGHHELAFTEDDSLAFVTNRETGTLSVIDVRKLVEVKDINVGSQPVALAFSSVSKTLYVANEGEGTIVVLDGLRQETLAHIKAAPGLRALRILPNGRFGFAVNPATNNLYIFDISTNRLVHVVSVGPASDQVAFTRQFAYVRSTGSEFVTMIKLTDLEKETAITRFPAGQKAPRESSSDSFADAIVPAPEDGAVFVANPADKMIYFYTEGMAAPMGSFQNYRRDPKAILVFDHGLRESAPGVYTTIVRLAGPGHYDMAFLLDSPRLVACFDFAVAENPDLPRVAATRIEIEPLMNVATAPVGENYTLRFGVKNSSANQSKVNLEDVDVLIFLAPGIWHERERAKIGRDGAYEVSFVPPKAGVYYFYFQCPSLKVSFNDIAPVTLRVVKR
jgi:YVTN family beta-propeller protein